MHLKIDGKHYDIEYTIEASLCAECTEAVTGLMTDVAQAQGEQDIRKLLSSMANIPQTTLTMFYAGLLENHGADGDKSVITKDDAKKLIKKYFKENPEDDFYGLMSKLMEQMGNDGFFKQIGLEQMTEEAQTKEMKEPQDHKKAKKKVTEK